MSFYSSIFIGKYFIFIVNAGDSKPAVIKFRDYTHNFKGEKNRLRHWHTKVYLYREILQRKWIEYTYKDRFIPSAKYDNQAPLRFTFPYTVKSSEDFKIHIESVDEYYREITIFIEDYETGNVIFEYVLKNVVPKRPRIITLKIKRSGIFRTGYEYRGVKYFKKMIISYDKIINTNRIVDFNELIKDTDEISDKTSSQPYCSRCMSKISFFQKELMDSFYYMNYIPFNDLIDTEKYSKDFINSYIMNLPEPPEQKKGLVHLLNIIRLSDVRNEMRVITNLFKDDPAFGYFITNRIFIFNIIPLIPDSDLQEILRFVDDETIMYSILDSDRQIKNKIINNISSRRAKDIANSHNGIEEKFVKDRVEDAKRELSKIIKGFFTEKYGRVLKIPFNKVLVYKSSENGRIIHSSSIVSLENNNLKIFEYKNGVQCYDYDVEYSGDEIFNIAFINDTGIFVMPERRIRYVKIHIYDWSSDVEDILTYENIDSSMAVPVSYYGNITILTIGALDIKDTPLEQVVKVFIKSG